MKMNIEHTYTYIDFTAVPEPKLSRKLIRGILKKEFREIAAHMTLLSGPEAARKFPDIECQEFSVEIEGSAFPNDSTVEDSNRLVHDMLHAFKQNGVDMYYTAEIHQKAGPFERANTIETNFKKPRSAYKFKAWGC